MGTVTELKSLKKHKNQIQFVGLVGSYARGLLFSPPDFLSTLLSGLGSWPIWTVPLGSLALRLLVGFGQWEAPEGDQRGEEWAVWGFIPLTSSLWGHLDWLDPSIEGHCSSQGLLYRLFPSRFSNLDIVLVTPSHLAVVTALLLLAKDDCTSLRDSPTPHSAFVNKPSLNYPNLRLLFPDGTDIDPHWTKSILLWDSGEILTMK